MTYMIHEFLNHMVTKWNMISNSFMQITHFVFLVLFLLIYECVERFFLSRNLNLAMLFVIDMCCHLSVESAISFSIWMNKTNLMRWESFFFQLENQWPCIRSNNHFQKLIIICQFMCRVPCCCFFAFSKNNNSNSSRSSSKNPIHKLTSKQRNVFIFPFMPLYTHFYSTLMNEPSSFRFCLINSLWYYTWTHL